MVDGWVYITAGGSRWHTAPDCNALAQGQADAAGRGRMTHPVQQVPASAVGGRAPCGWCVTVRHRDDSSAGNLEQLRTDTRWEQIFRDAVLAALPELGQWTIRSQPSLSLAGRTYRPDFTLTNGAARVAVEIDGADKGPNTPSHDDWTRRQTALVSDGCEVLRFTNRQVMHEQEYCRRQVASTVARLRERARITAAQPASADPAAPTTARRSSPPTSTRPSPATSVTPGRRKSRTLLPAALFVGVALVVGVGQHQGSRPEPSPPAGSAVGSTAPVDDGRKVGFVVCPPTHRVKGNLNQQGERIFHQPSDRFYNRTKPEVCFVSDTAAAAAGYRPAAG